MTRLEANINAIIEVIREHPGLSSRQIYEKGSVAKRLSYATLKRMLNGLLEKNHVVTTGRGKGTKYEISKAYGIIYEIEPDEYFKKEIDERPSMTGYNFDLIREALNQINIFSVEENEQLAQLDGIYKRKMFELTANEYSKALEHLAIDLSWKSSQIEGNTYSLLETERLLIDKETAGGKTKDEAVMLLNHKEAIDFVVAHPDYVKPLTVRAIEDIHSKLIHELRVDKNIRKRSVSITGTKYRPIDNEFQIREAMEEMCGLINLKSSVFEKALLALLLISYIQPFNDGNKRTARIICNALLINGQYCPLSFRSVDPTDYKKAMLIFYEQNNLSAFKKIFISQFEFAVNTYF